MSFPCGVYSLWQPDAQSIEDELFLSTSCGDVNWFKTRVYISWAALFLVQLLITVPLTVREWILYGASHGALILILACFNILGW